MMPDTSRHEVSLELGPTSWSRNRLCHDCRSIFLATDNQPTKHKASTLELRNSAFQGCHLCSLFYGCVPLIQPDGLPSTHVRVDGPWEAELSRENSADGDRPCLKVVLYVTDRRNESFQLELEGQRVSVGVQDDIAADMADSTGAEVTIATARSWLDECLRTHDGVCQEHQVSNWESATVPTRLLRIEDSNADLKVRLVSSKRGETIKYLILSYCWGCPKPDELKLTEKTEDELRHQVQLHRLPRTVKNAVTTTQKLGYRYLWVDRFCILQDDDADWKAEALRMGDYYRGADCCIAALSASDAHKGLFVQRNPLMLQPLNLGMAISKWADTWMSPPLERHVGKVTYPRLYRGPPFALSQRAWTLQERLLSPRTVYFGSLMTYWECRKTRRSEDFPTRNLDLPFAAVLRKFGSRTSSSMSELIESVQNPADEDLFHVPEQELELDKFEERWADLVEFYTARQMTYPEKDRLVAMSGMMSSITKETGQRFVHGLLVSRLYTELLWWQWVDCHGDLARLPERTSKQLQIPTWSWGSTIGRVSPFRSSRYLRVVRRDPWRVLITCCLQEEFCEKPTNEAKSFSRHSICVINFSVPLFRASITKRVDLRHYCWMGEAVVQSGVDSWIMFKVQIWPDEPVEQDMAVWLLHVASLPAEHGSARPFAGLVVVSLTDSTPDGLYRRVGYFEMYRPQALVNPPQTQREIAWEMALNHEVRCIKLV